MATAVTPRKDIYLSVLAGRAVTALINLASDPSNLSDRVENGLRDGIVYCQAVRLRGGTVLSRGPSEVWNNPLKRSVEDSQDDNSASSDICVESEKVERFLSQVVSKERKPEIAEIVAAIEFLRKTATDR